MARILCIDYGKKRTGLAVTDPLQIIAGGLPTIETHKLFDFLKQYTSTEEVETIVIGMPLNLDDSSTHATPLVKEAIVRLKKLFPQINIVEVDERFTSTLAKRAMLDMGMKKKDRAVKGNVDEIAATIMLQDYLNSINR